MGIRAGHHGVAQMQISTTTLRQWCVTVVAVVVVLLFTSALPVNSQLSENFYDSSCPNLTNIMRDAMDLANEFDPVNLPAVLRLFAHDAFVNGVDGSVLLDSFPGRPLAEKDAPVNVDLFGFEAIENAKFMVEDQCPGVVSCADILTLAAQLAIEMTGGPSYNSLLGRRDTTTSLATQATAQVPLPGDNMDKLKANFAAKGLTTTDLVALQGAHTIGFAHCSQFSHRIYDWNATVQFDPALDPTMAEQLRDVCSRRPDPNTVQPLDISTITDFDEQYFFNLQIQEGLLESDQLMGDHPDTSDLVNQFGNDKAAFFSQFVTSMQKFANFGVLTGSQGEIRSICNSTVADSVPTAD